MPRLLLAVALAVMAAGLTTALVSRANELAGRYGEHVRVAIAERTLRPGETVEAADISWQEVPRAFVGGTPRDDVVGQMVVSPVLSGEPVVAERLGPDGLGGPLALAPEGSRVVAVPAGAARPPLAAGDRVEVFAVSLDGLTSTRRVARDATVVAVTDEATTVAVTDDEVAGTARAALEQTAILALVGPDDRRGP